MRYRFLWTTRIGQTFLNAESSESQGSKQRPVEERHNGLLLPGEQFEIIFSVKVNVVSESNYARGSPVGYLLFEIKLLKGYVLLVEVTTFTAIVTIAQKPIVDSDARPIETSVLTLLISWPISYKWFFLYSRLFMINLIYFSSNPSQQFFAFLQLLSFLFEAITMQMMKIIK
jgi:hypothetical protein